MALRDENKVFAGGGMDQDSAPEFVAKNDYIFGQNIRNTGTSSQQGRYITNIESNIELSGSLPSGLNSIIGGGKFEDTGEILMFRYNSAGYNQILLYESSTKSYRVLYTDIIDSGGKVLLPLNPENTVTAILVNKTYAVWWAKDLEVGYTNLNTLKSGGYGTVVLAEDLSLLKPQCLIPPTGVYGNDAGTPANFLYGNLAQFAVQYVNDDFNYSTWSAWSKRLTPYQENTPIGGTSVSKNNYIIVTVNIGSIRASIINIACRFGLNIFYNIKSVTRDYVTSLPNTSVDISLEIREAYNPVNNTYSFAFYNNTINIPISPQESALDFDYIWPSNAGALINGNIIGLGNWNILYDRPNTDISVTAIGYDPNITIPIASVTNPLRKTGQFNGASGSGAGNHKRIMYIRIAGSPHTNDNINVTVTDIRNATNTIVVNYPVPPGQDGNLLAVATSLKEEINLKIGPASLEGIDLDGSYTITFTGPPYFGMSNYSIQNAFVGATVSNSIPSIPDNSKGQLALSYRDANGRFFPLCTGNNYIWNSQSYAQVNGNAIELQWVINDEEAPIGAVDYQWLITAPSVLKIVDTIATVIHYIGTWDSYSNSPSLSTNDGTKNVGDTYQITTSSSPADPTHYTNLGSNDSYNTGDYIVYNGKSWDILPKSFGNLVNNSILAFSLNSLNLYNETYLQQGVNTIIDYDFAPGDKCTLHYFIDYSGNINYFNNPPIDVAVLGYDAGNFILKVENSSALVYSGGHITYNGIQIDERNIFLRLYSPGLQAQSSQTSSQNTTVFYEIGERFPIINGKHSVLSGTIKDGGVYYKTREFLNGLKPYDTPTIGTSSYPNPIEVLATDLNYSDFYDSKFWSSGRFRTFYDQLDKTTQAASIITSQNFITGSRNNGLNRFYPSFIYGESDGQTSSSQGGIQIMWQRGQELIIGQEFGWFYIPVNEAYTVLNDNLTGQSISSKLLNNGRYSSEDIGIGTDKESFCTRYNQGFFVSPQNSEPYEINTQAGIRPYSEKMSKFFKNTLQSAFQDGKKIGQFYNDYYEEVFLYIKSKSNKLISFDFNAANWNPLDSFTISPSNVTATINGAHSTGIYNSLTGIITYTPTANYVGGDTAQFTFNPGITKNVCLNWTAGNGIVNDFSFIPLVNVLLNTVEVSNDILVFGNDFPVSISITGDPGFGYSVNGGVFTSSPGTVNSMDSVRVRVTSSASATTTTSCTLTIDSKSSIFNVTTTAPNFTATAALGMTIDSITDGTTTGVPSGFASANITPGNSLSLAYNTITSGIMNVTLSGTPDPVLGVRLTKYINGVNSGSQTISSAGTFPVSISFNINNPIPILVILEPINNFVLQAALGMDILVITGPSGTPSFLGVLPLSSGNITAKPFVSISAGTFVVNLGVSGSPPSPIYLNLSVNGIIQDSALLSGSGNYNLNLPSPVNYPDVVLISINI